MQAAAERAAGFSRSLNDAPWAAPAFGLLVAILSWPVIFSGPGGGLDSSWGAGLYMAVEQGLDFGDEVVWTYGPLGFLGRGDAPLWFDDLGVLSFLYNGLLHIGLCIAIVYSLSRTIGVFAASLAAFVALGILPGAEAPTVIAVALCIPALLPDRPRWAIGAIVYGGSFLAAFECLIKLSIGPPVILICLAALLGARAQARRIATFAGLFVAEFVALWLITGQSLGDLWGYLSGTRQVISGYSEAMGVELLSTRGEYLAVVLLLGFVGFAAVCSWRDGRARLGGAAIAALAGFALFKEGIVRYDVGHMTIFSSTIPVLLLLLPWPRTRVPLAAATAVAVIAAIVITRPEGYYADRLNPIDNVDLARAQAQILFDGDKREGIVEGNRALMKGVYDLSPEQLADLEGRTVAIEPWEIALAWAYDLDWSPLPVMQGYSAYTDELDEMNAEELSSGSGPERIVREGNQPTGHGATYPAIDNRNPAWDPPASSLAILCNYEELSRSSNFQVLGKIPDRCGEPELIGTVGTAFGEAVAVPEPGPGEVIFARIEGAGVEGLEKLKTLLYRADFRMAETNEGTYRLVPDSLGNGLLLRGDPEVSGSAGFEQVPGIENFTLTGREGDLTIEFFRMGVENENGEPEGSPDPQK